MTRDKLIRAIRNQSSIDILENILSDKGNFYFDNYYGTFFLREVAYVWIKKLGKDGNKYPTELESYIVKVLQLLIDAGADVKLRKKYGKTVYEIFISHYRGTALFKILKILIKAGADANAKSADQRQTALHLAAADDFQQVDFARFLLQQKEFNELDTPDNKGLTPLHEAVRNQNNNIIELLINAGADINKKVMDCGRTPLHFAAEVVNPSIIKYLLFRGADPSAKDLKGYTPVFSLTDLIYKSSNINELSLLETVEVLLSANTDINAVEDDGLTILHKFVDYWNEKIMDKVEYTRPLIYKTTDLFFKILKIFFKLGADFKIRNRGKTPLDMFLFSCMYHDYIETIYMLAPLESFIKFNIKDVDHLFTPKILLGSCRYLDYDILKFLVRWGADINVVHDYDYDMETPLLNLIDGLICNNNSASEMYYKKLLDYFLSLNPDFNIVSSNGKHILNKSKNYPKFLWKALVEYVAKRIYTDENLPHEDILETIENNIEYETYLDKCGMELKTLRDTKISSSWVSLKNILVDHEKKLVHYAENKDLVKDFNEFFKFQKYPIYGFTIKKRFSKAIQKQKDMEKSAVVLSSCLPNNFDPAHLVIKKIISYVDDLRYLYQPDFKELKI